MMHAYDIHLRSSVLDLDPRAWDELAGGHPFQRHAFFAALESSGCVGGSTAWQPRIVTLTDPRDGRLVGAAAAWEKTDSFGEFVYDWQWADLARRAGLPYYPKLVLTSPFSPVNGPRLLTHPALAPHEARDARSLLVRALGQIARDSGCTGAHALFCEPDDRGAFEREDWFLRESIQYHWHNRGYAHFEDFLAQLRSKRRKEVLRERRIVAESGHRVVAVQGPDLTDEHVAFLYAIYDDTCRRYGRFNRAYLNRDFFETTRHTLADALVAFLALDDRGEPVAGTWCLHDGHTLWGRYWGALRDVPMLHFETCYYAPIAWAIERGLQTMEPGAGGEHKVARGFDPVRTVSAHRFVHPGFERILRQITAHELRVVEDEEQLLRAHTSYRRGPEGSPARANPDG